jgi:hypothetical protein
VRRRRNDLPARVPVEVAVAPDLLKIAELSLEARRPRNGYRSRHRPGRRAAHCGRRSAPARGLATVTGATVTAATVTGATVTAATVTAATVTADTVTAETVAAETSAAETPAAETSAAETSTAETPAAETSAAATRQGRPEPSTDVQLRAARAHASCDEEPTQAAHTDRARAARASAPITASSGGCNAWEHAGRSLHPET